MTSTPSLRKNASKPMVNLESQSRSREASADLGVLEEPGQLPGRSGHPCTGGRGGAQVNAAAADLEEEEDV